MSEELVSKFNMLYQKYMKNIVQSFTDFDQLRNEFGSNLMAI